VAFVGPFTLLRRVIHRLNGVGWTRAAGNLAFVTLLGLVPLATVAFAFVAQFPIFQDFLKALENYLLRYSLPTTASTLVQTYVVGLATAAASLKGVWIFFVIVTAALVVDSVETEINEIWRITRKRPIMRRVIVYTIGVTAGPALVGGAILLYMGYNVIRTRDSQVTTGTKDSRNAVVAGIVMTAANPYFILWWATVGAALIAGAVTFGLVMLPLFAGVHLACDFAWYEGVSFAVFRSKRAFGTKWHKWLFVASGAIMLFFGLYFLVSSIGSML